MSVPETDPAALEVHGLLRSQALLCLQSLSSSLPAALGMSSCCPLLDTGDPGGYFASALAERAQPLRSLILGLTQEALSFPARVSGGINWQQGQVGVDWG